MLVFAIPCAAYVLVGALLIFRYGSFQGDAQARVANAYYVMFSRDPHLAAIGFVWNPLPSLSMLPLLPIKFLWTPLTDHAFLGNIMSAVFMAGAGYQLYRFFRDLGLAFPIRLGLFLAFAVNPMIAYYGANGMSEAPFIFALIMAARYLARWLADDRPIWLVISASALGLAYLTRSEAVFSAAFGAIVVVVVSFLREDTVRRERVYKALVDGFVFALPFAACFVGFAVVSWIIVGHPFEQFQSVYGNTSQLKAINLYGRTILSPSRAALQASTEVMVFGPGLVPFTALALFMVARRRDFRALAPSAMLGGVVVFAVVAFALGQTIGNFRYYIMSVPLALMLAGTAAVAIRVPRPSPGVADPKRLWPQRGAVVRAGAISAIVAIAAATVPTTAWAVVSTPFPGEEKADLGFILRPKPGDNLQKAIKNRYKSSRAIARDLDNLKLPNGSILIDNFDLCAPFIILDSKRPQQFIIPNDEDYQQHLADPIAFSVKYLMVPPNQVGDINSINRQYPTLYDLGAGISTKAMEWSLDGCADFHLMKLAGPGPS